MGMSAVSASISHASWQLPLPEDRLVGDRAGSRGNTEITQGPASGNAQATDRVELSGQSSEAQQEGSSGQQERQPQDSQDASAARGTDGEPLTEAEQKQVEELRDRDREVRTHEQAHKAAAGQYATSGPTYSYQTGPDGKRYAVGGQVGIDLSTEETPDQTIAKMAVVRRAALAPAEPSSQDRKVAAQASQIANEARAEKARLQQEEREAEQVEEADGSSLTVGTRPNSSSPEADQADSKVKNTSATFESSMLDLYA